MSDKGAKGASVKRAGNEGGSKLAGQLFLCFIGAALLLIGGVFGWLMLRSYNHAKASREWPQAEAVVLRSVIDERQIKGSPTEFRLNILYGYSYQGENLTSDRLTPRGAKWSKSSEAVAKLADEFPTGSEHMAWVNPEDTKFAILKHDTKAAGYSIWFPSLIMVGGAGMIWGALRKPKVAKPS